MITQQTDIEFLSGLAKSSVDLCLTDPPYIISKDSGMDRLLRSEDVDEKYGRKYAYATDYGDWDKDFTINDLDQSIYLIKRALREGGSFIVFFDMWKLETLKNILEFHKFSKIRIVEWVKTNPVQLTQKQPICLMLRSMRCLALRVVRLHSILPTIMVFIPTRFIQARIAFTLPKSLYLCLLN